MRNLSFRIFKAPQCIECNNKIDYRSDNGNAYLVYIIGKGKYNNRYYCLNCLDKLMKKQNI